MPPALGTYEATPQLWPFAALARACTRLAVAHDAVWRMPLWRAGAVFGQGFPAELPPGVERVSREEWPLLPDDYESLPRPAQRALYYQGLGPKPETEGQDPGMLVGAGVNPSALAGMLGSLPPEMTDPPDTGSFADAVTGDAAGGEPSHA